MSGTGVKQKSEVADLQVLDPLAVDERELESARERQAQLLRLLWERRSFLFRAAALGFVSSLLIAVLIPSTFTSTSQLMPPDPQSSSGLAMLAAFSGKTGGGLAGMAGDMLGLKSSGALFVGVLRSETAQDTIIYEFDLQKVYGIKLVVDARKKLDERTAISEDHKSGIITISVTDRKPERAAAIANAYVDELNSLVAQLSTSAAHRERVFLEDRLKVAKVDLDDAANQLAQFSSKNNTLDIQIEGKAMLDAAGSLAGQLIAAESELQGLRQIYTDNNARVRALNARVGELRKQLDKLGGSPETQQTSAQNANPATASTKERSGDKGSSTPFPSIRSLPLLGAKYTDYYRRAKIQETVYELLTEQFEMAKVQEAKETPSVKVLDPARVPERKSFPPRSLIILLGTLCGFAVAAVWVLGAKGWSDVDPADPRKVLALEVAQTMRVNAPWGAQNGDAPTNWSQKVWSRFRKHEAPPEDSIVS